MQRGGLGLWRLVFHMRHCFKSIIEPGLEMSFHVRIANAMG